MANDLGPREGSAEVYVDFGGSDTEGYLLSQGSITWYFHPDSTGAPAEANVHHMQLVQAMFAAADAARKAQAADNGEKVVELMSAKFDAAPVAAPAKRR